MLRQYRRQEFANEIVAVVVRFYFVSSKVSNSWSMYSAGVCGMQCARHSVGATRLQRSRVLYVSVNKIIAFKTCDHNFTIHYEVIHSPSGSLWSARLARKRA